MGRGRGQSARMASAQPMAARGSAAERLLRQPTIASEQQLVADLLDAEAEAPLAFVSQAKQRVLVALHGRDGQQRYGLRAESAVAAIAEAMPSVATDAGPLHPVLVPEGQENAVAVLWHRMVILGERRTRAEWVAQCDRDGLTPTDFGRRTSVLGGDQFGDWLRETFVRQLYAPVGDHPKRSDTDPALWGMGLHRSREEAETYIASLVDERAASWERTAHGLLANAPRWREVVAEQYPEPECTHRRLATVLQQRLSEGAMSVEQLVRAVQGAGLYDGRSWEQARTPVLEAMSDLRDCGQPVLPAPGGGFFWGETEAEIAAAAQSFRRRGEGIKTNAELRERNMGLVWPETDDDRDLRAYFTERVRRPKAPKRAPTKAAVEREAAQARLATCARDAASKRADNEFRASWAAAFRASHDGRVLTATQQRLLDEHADLKCFVGDDGQPLPKWKTKTYSRRWAWLPAEARVQGEQPRSTIPSLTQDKAPKSRLPEGELSFEQALNS